MSNIYGGDEVNSLVLDLGTYQCRVGYGGDDAPKAFFPSVVGDRGEEPPKPPVQEADKSKTEGKEWVRYGVGDHALASREEGMEVVSPYGEDGLIADWDIVESLYTYGLRNRLGLAPEEYAILASEPSHCGASPAGRAGREKHVELLFESFNAPAAFLAKSAVLASFATARQTSVVVDMGHAATNVVAVQDGYVLNKALARLPLGGALASRCMRAGVEGRSLLVKIKPRVAFKRKEAPGRPGEYVVEDLPPMAPSFHDYHALEVAADMKAALCRTCDMRLLDAQNAVMPTATYELPDGQEVSVGADRFKLPELMFQPDVVKTFPGMSLPEGQQVPSLTSAVMDVIGRCDVDVRKELYTGVVLTGGGSLYGGAFKERLERELGEQAPSTHTSKVKVVAPSNPMERRYATWIGGSILCSLGSFQQMWMSKSEYAEHGAALIHRKSP